MMSSAIRVAGIGVLIVAACAIGVWVLVSTTSTAAPLSMPAPPPTEAQARDALNKAVELARMGDFTALCDMGSGNCRRNLRDAGRDAVPAAPPTVFGTRVVEPTQLAGGGWALGGRVLEICGVDGRGTPYRGEVLVFRDGQTMRMIEPVSWSRIMIQSSGSVTAAGRPYDEGCPRNR